jgi:hypothetical protein
MGELLIFPILKARRPGGMKSVPPGDVVQLPGTQRSSEGIPTPAEAQDAFRRFRNAPQPGRKLIHTARMDAEQRCREHLRAIEAHILGTT